MASFLLNTLLTSVLNCLPTALAGVGYGLGAITGTFMAGIGFCGNHGTRSERVKAGNVYAAVVALLPATVGFLAGQAVVLVIRGSLAPINMPLTLLTLSLTHAWTTLVMWD